jgi:hypothetical protein
VSATQRISAIADKIITAVAGCPGGCRLLRDKAVVLDEMTKETLYIADVK